MAITVDVGWTPWFVCRRDVILKRLYVGKMVKYDVEGIANTVIACKYEFNESMFPSVSTETDKKVLIGRCGPVLHIPKMLKPHPETRHGSMALSKC